MAKKKSENNTSKIKQETQIPNLDYLIVKGAKEHNLKNIDLQIPRNQLVVITGISGSGKSSLAFDTIYAEGQRRYMESFSAYARQFLGNLERPDVDSITGLSPVISIEQKTTNKNPRSTVGTVTEIYDFLRLLFARTAEAYSYNTGKKMIRFSEQQIIDHIFEHFENQKIVILAPLVKGRKGHYRELFEEIQKKGYLKVRINGEIQEIKEKMQLDRYKIHDIEVVIDRLTVNEEFRSRLSMSLQTAFKMGNGLLLLLQHQTNIVQTFSQSLMCTDTGISYPEPSPNTFSFNSPYGYCPHCKGLGFIYDINMNLVIPNPELSIAQGGIAPLGEVRDTYTFKMLEVLAKKNEFNFNTPINQLPKNTLDIILYGSTEKITVPVKYMNNQPYGLNYEGVINSVKRFFNDADVSESVRRWAEGFMSQTPCDECKGNRLKKESLWFKLANTNIAQLCEMDIDELYQWFCKLDAFLNPRQLTIANELLKEIKARLKFLLNVGLNYLTLNRATRTLSGGESQRIRLATQIGSQLVGITYILDEPSIGLHQRDNHKLIETLKELANIGNTVLVVEHDRDIMLAANHLIDIGTGAGKHGGTIVAQGKPSEFNKYNTLTAKYLRHEINIPIPTTRNPGNGKNLTLIGATGNNLKNLNITIPLGKLVCITGVSGSGKSSAINATLYPILNQHFYRSVTKPLPYTQIQGLEHIDKVIEIDQSPIGRTPRSNPATYTALFTHIRDLFTQLPESKIRGYKSGRFSFNVKGGRCETCEGGGMKVIEMGFLPDVYVQCETCLGKRYNRETLEVRYKGKSISDVLNMTVEEATLFFEAIPKIYRIVKTLNEVGLGYITLGQQATTLSGGEAQRVKLATELSKRDTGKTFYILDEPTTGLHFEDIRILLQVINKLVQKGNSMVIIEHNLDVIKIADYIIDMGLEGGNKGGYIIAQGTPEEVAKNQDSHTAKYLRYELNIK